MLTEFTVIFVLLASSNLPLAMLRLRERNRGCSTPFTTEFMGLNWEFSGNNIVRVRIENARNLVLPRPLRWATRYLLAGFGFPCINPHARGGFLTDPMKTGHICCNKSVYKSALWKRLMLFMIRTTLGVVKRMQM
jgi:hypothetical protein